jgi:glucose-1-phosphate thymidylyltransferase
MMETSTSVRKCVILARGLGRRMQKEDNAAQLDAAQTAAADSGVKAMIPVGRPFLDYVLSSLADAGFSLACLVVGPEHLVMRQYYGHNVRPTRIAVTFALQAEALGTANAVLAAEEFAGPDEFLVINGDNYYPPEALQQIQCLGQPGAVLFEAAALVRHGNVSGDRIRAFASCVVDSDGFLSAIVEKPESPGAGSDDSKLVSMNCWRFGPAIFSACRDVPLSSRRELELPLAVQLGIRRGLKFKVAVSCAGVLDLSRRSDIAKVAERLERVEVHV